MLLIAFAVAMQTVTVPPPPPPPDGTVLNRAFEWQCEIRDTAGRVSAVAGSFDAFVQGQRGALGHVTSDSSGRFAGDHKIYLSYGENPDQRSSITMIVANPDTRLYYHFHFNFYGAGKAGHVTVEEQRLAREPNYFGTAGAGLCRMGTA